MWLEGHVDVGRGGTLWPVVHTRPRLALNLCVRELSKRHDSCECTISSLLERAPPCHVQKAGWSARLLLFLIFLPILWLFWETDWLLQQDVQVWYPFVLYLVFLLFDHGSSSRSVSSQTAPSPNESEASSSRCKVYANTHRFHLCVCVCVYRYIYKEREIFMNLFFSYFVMRAITKKQTEKTSLFWWSTAMLFWSVDFLGSRLWILVVH